MDKGSKPKIIVIVGPTGSGKTSLSLEIASRFDGEVISADSRQVYKKLDIGTEKITETEMDGVPHHVIDVADINTLYTATDFKRDAVCAIAEITKRGHTPIVAGGTFFYIDTLLGTMSAAPVAPNPRLRMILETQNTETLFAELEKKDPTRAHNIDRHNKRRLVRALEIIDAVTTVPIQHKKTESPYDVLKIGIQVDKILLRKKLRARAELAFKKGIINETKELLSSGVSTERLSEIGHEYRISMEFLNGHIDEKTLIQKFEEKNWQYAKRQLMWLKRDPNIVWFERESTEEIFKTITAFLSN